MNEDIIKGYQMAIESIQQFIDRKESGGHPPYIVRDELYNFSEIYVKLLQMEGGMIPMDITLYVDYVSSKLTIDITQEVFDEIASYHTPTTYVKDADNIINYMNNK